MTFSLQKNIKHIVINFQSFMLRYIYKSAMTSKDKIKMITLVYFTKNYMYL